ncbi:uncharacterized protein LOC117611487 [Osmia lignaria lignaria]|uniref:uncharacterized protein LOC117611487 n=1 Tax=Osmia lignaria lignaria TaxID=1437193 RepID=UPI00402BC210
MDTLIRENKVHVRLINNALLNFKKLGKQNHTPAVIRSRINLLKDYWAKFQSTQIQIEVAASEENTRANPYFSSDVFGDTEAAFLAALDAMTAALPTDSEPASNSCNTSTASCNRETALSVKLPRVELPKFSGDYTEWENFRDLFQSLVGSNDALPKVQKWHYLKLSLIGEASLLLKNVSTSAANYEAAWKLLTDRYANERALITAHLKMLFDSPPIGSAVLSDLKSLRDRSRAALTALKNMARPVEYWDDVLVFHFVRKLDKESHREWELRMGEEELFPSLADWEAFLNVRIRTLESLASSCGEGYSACKNKSAPIKTVKAHLNASETKCVACGADHALFRCDVFRGQSVEQRLSLAREHHRCFNCLQKGHLPAACPSKRACSICKGKHHSLLHSERKGSKTSSVSKGRESTSHADLESGQHSAQPTYVADNNMEDTTMSTSVNTHFGTSRHEKKVVLATAWIKVGTREGRQATLRALINPGSEATFIRENVANALRANRQHVQASVSGIGAGTSATVRASANVTIEPCHGKGPVIPVRALILKRLTNYRSNSIDASSKWIHLRGLEWADPLTNNKAPVDLIIGADNYGAILLDGLRKGLPSEPVAQKTIFGWVLTGPARSIESHAMQLRVHYGDLNTEINNTLRKFWEVEAPPPVTFLSEEDKQCEDHFRRTYSRKPDGKYVARLPFKSEPPIDIGASKGIAVASFYRLEKRLAKDAEQATAYHSFLEEYLRLGHMREFLDSDPPLEQKVYLSHHPVIRQDSSTTKLRVVFNASMPTSNGSTLNDHLLVGPKLQADLAVTILRWRMYQFVFAADIAKMFRQIWIDHRDIAYQLIVWRAKPEDQLKTYELLTVTYGTAPAPFLANRVIKQLALDEGTNLPLAAPILNEHLYVDDALFGADDRVLARQTRQQVTDALRRGGFHLRKWSSNCPQLLTEISHADHELASSRLFQDAEGLKMLGIRWLPKSDEFQFQFKFDSASTANPTKRVVLSNIARIFDPLGWISPVVIVAKIFMQRLWLAKLDWDESLPCELTNQWREYSAELKDLPKVTLPRWIRMGNATVAYEIHGFADVSQDAYAAVIYLRTISIADEVALHLLMAKTKVAPLKPLTFPRLELCACVLMTRLIEQVQATLKLDNVPVYGWTDSTVALAWIHRHPSQLKTFTAHRVTEIQSRAPNASWRHVPTGCNPADCASRGLSVNLLLHHPLWWHGPSWLAQTPNEWPEFRPVVPREAEAEIKNQINALHVESETEWDLPTRTSSWQKLLRITAYVTRFISRVKTGKHDHQDTVVTTNELVTSRKFWVQQVQARSFRNEIKALKKSESLAKSSPLFRLNPFLDEDGTIRVGGRLRNSDLMERFPIILPVHRVTELIIADCHANTLHGGIQLTLSVLRRTYWVINARRLVKSHIYKCIRCVRWRAATVRQQMSDLPTAMVTPARPFAHCGVEYAGPFFALAHRGRGQKAHKVYIALFIFLSTRAIHLELVRDYSTAAFLTAFNRFTARRGLPTKLYSDNGTTFQGANKELKAAFKLVTADSHLRALFAADHITWHFIPPSSPHFGGIWEAGVKSVKTHLRRMLCDRTPSCEEFNTLLCQIEACLNSRPLAPLKDDLESCEALTPGHFLVGGVLKVPPAPSVIDITENRLSRWQWVQQLTEKFWKVWAHEYLQSLQARSKWCSRVTNLKIGDLVLLKSSTLPPGKWDLGRVTKCHPGKDGLVRVVSIKTARSECTRPVVNLCKLPISS